MNENNELLTHIYKDASMGITSISNLINDIRKRQNNIKPLIESELKCYEYYKKKSEKLLKKYKCDIPEENVFAKIGNKMGIKKEVMMDNSDSALAAMLIEGFTMGIVNMENKVSDYKKICSEDTLDLAKNFLKFQQKEIEKLKKIM